MSIETRRNSHHIFAEFHPLRAARFAPFVLAVSLGVWKGGEAIGLNFDSKRTPTVPAHELLGPADPTAPDIKCSGSSRAINLSIGGRSLSGLVHSNTIPGANRNESQAVDAIAALNPGVDLADPGNRAIAVPDKCE